MPPKRTHNSATHMRPTPLLAAAPSASSRVGALCTLFAATFAATTIGVAPTAAQETRAKFPNTLVEEAKSKTLCESEPNRIHVETRWGSECVAYFATKGQEHQKSAVIFFDGDVALAKFAEPRRMFAAFNLFKDRMQQWADRLNVRYVYISRVGVNGSSGNHGDRRKPNETMILNAATDRVKGRLGLDRIVLAGQSGGSTIAASMLSLGRSDVSCAVLGSGAFELVALRHAELERKGFKVSRESLEMRMLDPSELVNAVAKDSQRRIVILGDSSDSRTPFDQQRRYAEALAAKGHHVKLIEIDAQGTLDHAATQYVIPTAGACLNGLPDDELISANNTMSRAFAAAEVAKAGPLSGSLALINSSLRAGRRAEAFSK